MRGEEVGRFHEVAGMSIVDADARRSVFAVDTLTVDSRVAFQLRDESSSWGGWGGGRAYAWHIPQQDFALKLQGGLMREWGICRTLRYIYEAHVSPTEAKCYTLSKSVMRSKYAIIGLFDFNPELSHIMMNCHIL